MLDFLRGKRVATFWEWLAMNTDRIQSDRESPAKIGREIQEAFTKRYPNLLWEIAPVPNGPWSFCVSAGGDRARFDDVRRAVDAAPALPGWIVRAFKQRWSQDSRVRSGSFSLSIEDVWCSAERADDGIDLTLWIRGLSAETDGPLSGAAVVLLDNAVGEYDAATKVRGLERRALPAYPEDNRDLFPLRELPAVLDGLPSSN